MNFPAPGPYSVLSDPPDWTVSPPNTIIALTKTGNHSYNVFVVNPLAGGDTITPTNPSFENEAGTNECPTPVEITACIAPQCWQESVLPNQIEIAFGKFLEVYDSALAIASITGDATIPCIGPVYAAGDTIRATMTSAPMATVTLAPPPNGLREIATKLDACGALLEVC